MKVHDVRRSLGLAIAAALVLGACKSKEAESASAATPPSVAIGAENVTVVGSGDISSGPAISGSLAAERGVAPEALIANADYLQKPYRSETLLGKIDSLLRAPEQLVETSNPEEAKQLTAA